MVESQKQLKCYNNITLFYKNYRYISAKLKYVII